MSNIKSQIQSAFSIANKNPLIPEFFLFSFTTFLLLISRLVAYFWAAKLLGPETWGKWFLFDLVIIYGPNFQFGTLNAMNKDVPLYRGKQNFDKIVEIQSNSFGFQIIISILCAFFIFLYGFVKGPLELKWTYLFFCLFFLFHMIYLWEQFYLKSMAFFNYFSQQQAFFAFFFVLFTIPFTYWKGLSGFITGQLLATSIMVVLIWKQKVSVVPRWNRTKIIQLIRIGFPIMLVGLIFSLFKTIDRWIVIAFFTEKQLGYFSIAIMSFNVLLILQMVVAQQVYPRMAEAWGRTQEIKEILKWVRLQIGVSVLLSILAATIFAFLIKFIINHFLIEYSPGLAAVYPMLFGPVFLSFAGAFGNLLNTINKQNHYLAVQIFTLPIFIGLDIWFVKNGYGLPGVALGTSITFFIYSLILSMVGIYHLKNSV
ncbi:MAG: oligosaccharide flippase family protein [Desulfobacteraceae bacterium]|nr:oligosaccharide flippase family protein [Desulfobacteraceae bacterium]